MVSEALHFISLRLNKIKKLHKKIEISVLSRYRARYLLTTAVGTHGCPKRVQEGSFHFAVPSYGANLFCGTFLRRPWVPTVVLRKYRARYLLTTEGMCILLRFWSALSLMTS